MEKLTLFWHRRDLRAYDNAGLHAALRNHKNVQPVFIFDTDILDHLPKQDARIDFIDEALQQLNEAYQKFGARLWVFYGNPQDIFKELTSKYNVEALYSNRDYESYAKNRDSNIYEFLKSKNIPFIGKKDHVVFEKNEVVKGDGLPYTVFTPYSKIWKNNLSDYYFKAYPIEQYADNFNATDAIQWDSVYDHGFIKTNHSFTAPNFDDKTITNYKEQRDFPAKEGTTKLSVHLRFGTVSIRECVRRAMDLESETWLNELIWRDFYQSILFHFPHVETSCFRSKYEKVEWEKNEEHFEAWCKGKTGYPLVDAGMRELNETGFMHNRVRMVVASFLTKHLLLDWRWGEAYFAEKLLDFDLASNNGGWQWAAGCGTDAAPYFRVFNPTSQLERFDKKKEYVKKWVPEFGTTNYPEPIVEHKFARQRALDRYKDGLG